MAIIRWKPWGELADWTDEVERRMQRLFDVRSEAEKQVWAPRVDIKETANELVVSADVPGIDKKDVNVSMKEGVLSISGERKSEQRAEGENWHRIERVFGSFQRSFYIPVDVDESKIKASYKDGVLNIALPKKEEAKKKEIPIQVE